jgi:hypothetical protein
MGGCGWDDGCRRRRALLHGASFNGSSQLSAQRLDRAIARSVVAIVEILF